MKRNSFYPSMQNDQIVWHSTFASEIKIIGPAIGLTPEQVAAAVADCMWLIYLMQYWLPAIRVWSITGTNTLGEAQTGEGFTPMILPIFVAPALPDLTVPVDPGALDRIFELVQLIKNSGKCSDKPGHAGHYRQRTGRARLHRASSPLSPSASSVDRWSSNGTGAVMPSFWMPAKSGWTATTRKGSVLLTVDPTPGFTDPQPFPAAHTVWTYRAIYQVDDARVGVWSQDVSIAVQA